MFSTEQQDYEFNWEDMNRKVLHIIVGKDSYDGNEEYNDRAIGLYFEGICQ